MRTYKETVDRIEREAPIVQARLLREAEAAIDNALDSWQGETGEISIDAPFGLLEAGAKQLCTRYESEGGWSADAFKDPDTGSFRFDLAAPKATPRRGPWIAADDEPLETPFK